MSKGRWYQNESVNIIWNSRWAFTEVKFVATCPAAAVADAKIELSESTARLLAMIENVTKASQSA